MTVPADSFSVRRLWALLQKEGLQIRRDPSAISIALIMPLVLLFLYGFGISLDAREVPIGLVAEEATPESASLFAAFAATPYLQPVSFENVATAEAAVMRGQIRGFVVLRPEFARRLVAASGPAPIQLVVDGVDANTARIVSGYVDAAIELWLEERGLEHGRPHVLPVTLEQRVWFNPEIRSTDFLVPGLVALVMTLIGALLTALVVAREWERGTMEAIMASPATTLEILAGKLIANFILGMGGMAVSVALAILLFGIPFRGSLAVLILVSAVFLVTALGIGLLISTAAKNQFVAAQAAFIATYMPALMLSGFLFDIRSMPGWLQLLTRLVPARYFVSSLQTLFLAGNVWPILLPNLASLVGFALFFSGVTLLRTRRRLD